MKELMWIGVAIIVLVFAGPRGCKHLIAESKSAKSSKAPAEGQAKETPTVEETLREFEIPVPASDSYGKIGPWSDPFPTNGCKTTFWTGCMTAGTHIKVIDANDKEHHYRLNNRGRFEVNLSYIWYDAESQLEQRGFATGAKTWRFATDREVATSVTVEVLSSDHSERAKWEKYPTPPAVEAATP